MRIVLATTWLIVLTSVTPIPWAQSGNPGLVDLSLSGWTQDLSLDGIEIDQYRSASGSVLHLVAFPPMEKTAARWLDHAMPLIAGVAADADQEWSVGDEEEDGKNGSCHSFLMLLFLLLISSLHRCCTQRNDALQLRDIARF